MYASVCVSKRVYVCPGHSGGAQQGAGRAETMGGVRSTRGRSQGCTHTLTRTRSGLTHSLPIDTAHSAPPRRSRPVSALSTLVTRAVPWSAPTASHHLTPHRAVHLGGLRSLVHLQWLPRQAYSDLWINSVHLLVERERERATAAPGYQWARQLLSSSHYQLRLQREISTCHR